MSFKIGRSIIEMFLTALCVLGKSFDLGQVSSWCEIGIDCGNLLLEGFGTWPVAGDGIRIWRGVAVA